ATSTPILAFRSAASAASPWPASAWSPGAARSHFRSSSGCCSLLPSGGPLGPSRLLLGLLLVERGLPLLDGHVEEVVDLLQHLLLILGAQFTPLRIGEPAHAFEEFAPEFAPVIGAEVRVRQFGAELLQMRHFGIVAAPDSKNDATDQRQQNSHDDRDL